MTDPELDPTNKTQYLPATFQLNSKDFVIDQEGEIYWDISKIQTPIEVVTTNSTFIFQPTDEPYCFRVTSGELAGERVGILGSCLKKDTGFVLRPDQIVIGQNLVVMLENGSRLMTSTIVNCHKYK
ncbi:MAG: hypothetical protein AB1489_38740 [Acidobacteriota bacterium]